MKASDPSNPPTAIGVPRPFWILTTLLIALAIWSLWHLYPHHSTTHSIPAGLDGPWHDEAGIHTLFPHPQTHWLRIDNLPAIANTGELPQPIEDLWQHFRSETRGLPALDALPGFLNADKAFLAHWPGTGDTRHWIICLHSQRTRQELIDPINLLKEALQSKQTGMFNPERPHPGLPPTEIWTTRNGPAGMLWITDHWILLTNATEQSLPLLPLLTTTPPDPWPSRVKQADETKATPIQSPADAANHLEHWISPLLQTKPTTN